MVVKEGFFEEYLKNEVNLRWGGSQKEQSHEGKRALKFWGFKRRSIGAATLFTLGDTIPIQSQRLVFIIIKEQMLVKGELFEFSLKPVIGAGWTFGFVLMNNGNATEVFKKGTDVL